MTSKVAEVEFYTQKVGFEKKTDVTGPSGYRYATVGPRGQKLEFALCEVGSFTDPPQQECSKSWTPGRAPPVPIDVPDCRATYEELHGRGVYFRPPPRDHPWDAAATFRDPDGNLFSLSQLRGGR